MGELRDNYWFSVIRDELSYSEENLNLFENPDECISLLQGAITFIVENKGYPVRITHYLKQIEKDYTFQKEYIAEKLEILINDLSLFEGMTDRDIDQSMTNVLNWIRETKYPTAPQQNERISNDKNVLNHIQKTNQNKVDLFFTFIKTLYGDVIESDITVADFAKETGGFDDFENEYEYRKQNAPQWEAALTKWITEIESFSGPDNLYHRDQVSNECYIASFFRDITSSGKCEKLFMHIGVITNSKDLFSFEVNRSCIDAVIKGVVYAYKLPELENELIEMKNRQVVSNDLKMEQQVIRQKNNKPIWWQGTGRQLGYLLDELAAKGFIDKNTNFNEAIKTHFIDKDKNPFKDSIKQNKSGTGQNKNQKPKGAESLDEILKELPNKK
ncbi:MAG: hypothetical protein QM594_11905 [Niabella sp.]